MSKQRKNRMTDLEKTAYHEAGHAVIAVLVRRPFSYVTIEPTEDAAGHLQDTGGDPRYAEADGLVSRRLYEAVVMSNMGGHIAEALAKGRKPTLSGMNSHDFQSALLMAEDICRSERECGAYIRWLHERTAALLNMKGHWAGVEAIAGALLKHKRIGRRKAGQIVRAELRDAAQPFARVLPDL